MKDGLARTVAPVLPDGAGFFFFQRITLGGRKTSLYALENTIVRGRFDEPRIHFALNCASIGCPRLPAEAFVPERLEAQLARETARFLAEPRNVTVDAAAGELRLSSIFDWYVEDFPPSLREWVHAHAAPTLRREIEACPDCRVAFVPYDWALNDQRPLRRLLGERAHRPRIEHECAQPTARAPAQPRRFRPPWVRRGVAVPPPCVGTPLEMTPGVGRCSRIGRGKEARGDVASPDSGSQRQRRLARTRTDLAATGRFFFFGPHRSRSGVEHAGKELGTDRGGAPRVGGARRRVARVRRTPGRREGRAEVRLHQADRLRAARDRQGDGLLRGGGPLRHSRRRRRTGRSCSTA